MEVPASYRPNESAAEIFSEHTWLQGAFLVAVAYGIEFVLYVMACQLLWTHRRTSGRRNILLISYVSVIFLLSTLYVVAVLEFTQLSFIDDRNIDGGPNQFETVMYSLPIDMLGNVTLVVNSWLCDIINVWRCYVVYKDSRVPIWVVTTIPILLYLASIALGILFLKQVAVPSQSPWAASGINFTIPYYTISLALNIFVTILIVLRLLLHRRRITQAMGSAHGSQYTSLITMVVESAVIYSAFALAFLIPFVLNSAVSQLFLQALSIIQGVTTFLIIFRIAQGKSWSEEIHTAAVKDSFHSRANRTIGGHTIQFRNQSSLNPSGQSGLGYGSDDPILMRKMRSALVVDMESGIQISKTVTVEEST